MNRPDHLADRSVIEIRDVSAADLPGVLALNELSVPSMNSLTMERMRWFADTAAYFRVAEIRGSMAGFLICMAPEAPYRSPNFLWLLERYREFLYIDRVAVSAKFRRRGIAGALYRDAAGTAPMRFKMLACEVNLRPRNPESLRFHERYGFESVGTQDHGDVEVQYMIRPLPL